MVAASEETVADAQAKWKGAEVSVEDVDGGICITVGLPHVVDMSVKIEPRYRRAVQIRAKRLPFTEEQLAEAALGDETRRPGLVKRPAKAAPPAAPPPRVRPAVRQLRLRPAPVPDRVRAPAKLRRVDAAILAAQPGATKGERVVGRHRHVARPAGCVARVVPEGDGHARLARWRDEGSHAVCIGVAPTRDELAVRRCGPAVLRQPCVVATNLLPRRE